MREQLLPFMGQRLAVTGTVARFGTRPRWQGLYSLTILLHDIRTTDGRELTDHVWLVVGSRLAALDPQVGDVLAFRGTVGSYFKNKVVIHERTGQLRYTRRTEDITLRYPAKLAKLVTSERSH